MTDYYTDNEFATSKFEVELKEDKEIDIDEVLRIEKEESGREYVAYKNKGKTLSGYTRSFSLFDIAVVKAIKQLDKKIKEVIYERSV